MNKSWSFFRHRLEWILPTRDCPLTLYNKTMQCPREIETVLRYEYGDDWKTGRTGRPDLTTNTSVRHHDYWNLYYQRPKGWHQKPSGLKTWGKEWMAAHAAWVPWAHCSLDPSQWCRFDRVRRMCNARRKLAIKFKACDQLPKPTVPPLPAITLDPALLNHNVEDEEIRIALSRRRK